MLCLQMSRLCRKASGFFVLFPGALGIRLRGLKQKLGTHLLPKAISIDLGRDMGFISKQESFTP